MDFFFYVPIEKENKKHDLLFATGVDAFSSESDSLLVGSLKHLEGQAEGETGTLKSVEVGRGGDAKTGVFSLKDSLRGEPSEGRLYLGGEPWRDSGRLHPFSSPGRGGGTKWVN